MHLRLHAGVYHARPFSVLTPFFLAPLAAAVSVHSHTALAAALAAPPRRWGYSMPSRPVMGLPSLRGVASTVLGGTQMLFTL